MTEQAALQNYLASGPVSRLHTCSCGFYGDPVHQCTCSPGVVSRYQKRIEVI